MGLWWLMAASSSGNKQKAGGVTESHLESPSP